MPMPRLHIAALLAALVAASPAAAQEPASAYPSRNIELVVPFAAGGSADVIARMLAQVVSESWPHPVVVQNRAGATGALASEYVLRAPADGYTILLDSASTHSVLPAYRSDLPYDTVTSFSHITLLVTFPQMMVINPKKVPAKTAAEFIDYLKAHPGKANFASSGSGGASHFAGELFKIMSKTEITHVPYRGNGPALTDLLAGNVDMTIDNMTAVWPQVKEGNLRALGVGSLKRTPLAPDVPALAETLPGYEALSWIAIAGPAGMPPGIVTKIAKAFAGAAQRPDIVKRLQELGGTAAVTATPAELVAFITKDRERWREVARTANLGATK